MIVGCKICKGSGRVSKVPFDVFSEGEVCPACKGAGEFEIVTSSEKLTNCKFCGGQIFTTSLMRFIEHRHYSA